MIRSSKQEYVPTIETSTEPEAPTPAPAPVQSPTLTPRTVPPTAVIGAKIRFKGELVGEEDLLIQGHIDGTVDLKNHNLTIGENGVIKANVLAKTITIEGSVEGDVYGKEQIAIKSSSKVRGNLVADRVTLEDGAKFKGSIDMDISAHKGKFESPKTLDSSATKDKTTEPA